MPVNQLSIFIENKPRSLSSLCEYLHENNIDIRALSIADVQDYGILRIIVEDVYNASTVLKNGGYVFKITPVLAVPIKDASGGLAEVMNVLGEANINVEYLYAFVGRQKDCAYVIFRVANIDTDKASRLLAEKGFEPLSEDELARIYK